MKNHFFYLSLTFLALFFNSCSQDEGSEQDPLAPKACIEVANEGNLATKVAVSFKSDCSENASSYFWEFGDGETSAKANPEHVYQEEGTFTVFLTVTDSLQNTDKGEKSISIGPANFTEHSGYIDEPEVWQEGLHLIVGNIRIRHGSLTIEPGATVLLEKEESIFVGHEETMTEGGALFSAVGTEAKPISFLPASGELVPGEWGHIFFTEKASASSAMKYCKVQYGGKSDAFNYPDFGDANDFGLINLDQATVAIDNSEIKGALNWGVGVSENAYFSSFTNNTISETNDYPLTIDLNSMQTIGEGNTFETETGVYVFNQYFNQLGATWQALNVPYYFQLSVRIGSTINEMSLTIQPGTTLAFAEQAVFETGGEATVIAEGTETDPIIFTTQATSKSPGSWEGLYISGNTTMRHTVIEYAGKDRSVNFVSSSSETIFTDNLIRESERDGVYVNGHDWDLTFENNHIENCGRFGINTFSSNVHLVPLSNTFSNTKGYLVSSQGIRGEVIWPIRDDIPYVISGTLNILGYDNNEFGPRSLTLPAGTRLQLRTNASIEIARSNNTTGALIAQGTSVDPVTFTLADIDVEEGSGNWGTIWFANEGATSTSVLTNCVIENGGNYHLFPNFGMVHFSFTNTSDAPVFNGNVIKNSTTYGVSKEYTTIDVSDNTFENNTLGDVATLN